MKPKSNPTTRHKRTRPTAPSSTLPPNEGQLRRLFDMSLGLTELSEVDRLLDYAIDRAVAERDPAYVGETPTARVIPLVVYAINASETTRRSDLATLLGYLDSTAGLVELRWTEGSTYRYWCSVTEAQADADFSVFTANLVAPNPVKETV